MKTNLTSKWIASLLFAFWAGAAGGQITPDIQWQATFGGTNSDMLRVVIQTGDGGYILGGSSTSGVSGNKVSGNFGGNDYWVAKLAANGSKLWETNFGGSSWDVLTSLQPTSDGGCILGGYANSSASGNKTSGNFGGYDYWLVKLTTNGSKLWETNFGGWQNDYLTSLCQTSDGGYIVGGYSRSGATGNKTSASVGLDDYWIVKLDANGAKLWENAFGGDSDDHLYSLQPTSDGGYILGGSSWSLVSGDKSSTNFGGCDYWVVKLDGNGTKQWDRSFGSPGWDELYTIQTNRHGGYLLGGYGSSQAGGNKTSAGFGNHDYWLVELDVNGTKVGERAWGGQYSDDLYCLQQTKDGGMVLGGYSASGADGNKTCASFGASDYWVVKLDAGGAKLWEMNLGGNINDELYSVRNTADGGLILGGSSASGVSGNKTSNCFAGSFDYWVVKLAPSGFPILGPRLEAALGNTRTGPALFVSWATNNAAGFGLETSVTPTNWLAAGGSVLEQNGQFTFIAHLTNTARYFRLRKP